MTLFIATTDTSAELMELRKSESFCAFDHHNGGVWHINADEPRALDYNVEFKSAGQVDSLYAPDPFRSSDHDPVLVSLSLAPRALNAPTAGFTSNSPVRLGNASFFTNTSTGDLPLAFWWDFGDGLTSTVEHPAHTYALTGTFTVTLQVTNLAGTDGFAGTHRVYGDEDADGVDDEVEDQGPFDGDGNQDGIPDSQQENVATLPGVTGGYVTFAAPKGVRMVGVRALADPSDGEMPEGFDFPHGFFGFSLDGLAGDTVMITLTVHTTGTMPNAYWKYGPTADDLIPHWYAFGYDGTTGARFSTRENGLPIVLLHFKDGARGDADLAVNGSITDPGGPAVQTRWLFYFPVAHR